jgi:hypothetical protein
MNILYILSRSDAECICEDCGGLVMRVDLQHCVESVLADLHSLKFLRGDSATEHLHKAQAIYNRCETNIECFLFNPNSSNLFISGLISQDNEKKNAVLSNHTNYLNLLVTIENMRAYM